MESIVTTIKQRTSVRTFDKRPLTAEDRAALDELMASPSTPFDVPVCLRVLTAEEHGVKSPVVVGTNTYVAGKVARVPNAELAFGYAFEELCLELAARGMGTTMLAASLNRKVFEEAMNVGPNEVMPVASPVGYPASKRSMRETMMRKAIKSDERLPFGELFFTGAFGRPLAEDACGAFRVPLTMVRLAPSATNRQPWRAVVVDGAVHFYVVHSLKPNALGDIQLVDMGIALAHFDLTRKELGLAGEFVQNDPGIAVPEATEYVASFVTA